MTVRIKRMTVADVDYVVKVHLASFPSFFLSSLGARFLYCFYSKSLLDPDVIAYVCIENCSIKGFVLGSANPHGFYKRLLKAHWISFVLAALPSVIKSPGISARLVRALAYPSTQVQRIDCAGLFSIGVNPNSAGKGLGRILLNAFVSHAKSCDCTLITLTTDAINNEYANNFYVSNGFDCAATYTTKENRKMNIYNKSLI